MPSKKENLKSLFSNTRTRIIIVFTFAVLLGFILLGYLKFHTFSSDNSLSSELAGGPGDIQSIPGAINPTAQYAKLQQQQNLEQAEQAQTSGTSAIPTIIRTQSVGSGVGVIGSQSGVGFSALAREDEGGPQRSLWIQQLQNANCSKAAINQVLNQGGLLSDLKGGCSCIQLKDNGYGLSDLQSICSCKELRAAGINVRQLKELNYSTEQLRACGFDACALRNAGYSAQQMKDGGFSDGELKGAGFPEHEIAQAGGLPNGMTAEQVLKAGCDSQRLAQLKTAGVSVAAIRRISGCSINQLKDSGYSPADLKNGGYSAADLTRAGFSPAQLKDAGYNARDLLNAGVPPEQLVQAGYSPAQLQAADAELPPGITPADVQTSGCSANALQKERSAGVSAFLIKQYGGCQLSALKAAQFSPEQLTRLGYTPQQVEAASALSDGAIHKAGCDVGQLQQLYKSGVDATRLRQLNGCNATVLKRAGFDPQSLSAAGFTPEQLVGAGFLPEQLNKEAINPSAALAAGRTGNCNAGALEQIKSSGLSANAVKQTLGCPLSALKNAGFSPKELKAAGFTAAELKNAGFSPSDLKTLGYTAKELKAAGFNAGQLKAAGFTPEALRQAGFKAADLKKAGFNAKALKGAGYTADDMKAAGYNENDLANAGFAPSPSAVAGLGQPVIPSMPSNVTSMPSIGGPSPVASQAVANTEQLQSILNKQNNLMAEQKYQQKIQQRMNQMMGAANQDLQDWKKVSTQTYMSGNEEKKSSGAGNNALAGGTNKEANAAMQEQLGGMGNKQTTIKTGDIVFAVMDTAVNSDEPGPILATIVSGKLKGTKLIGSFNLPSNANSMVISFNTMSIPSAPQTISISAYAIDPNTARTALSSRTDHHYLTRYGSLFASSFLEGFGNAFQSADTTVTIGGTGSGNDITVQNGIGRSALENAVIGLATVGKSWGQVAQQNFNTPVTVEVYAGTGIGVLFTQDVTL